MLEYEISNIHGQYVRRLCGSWIAYSTAEYVGAFRNASWMPSFRGFPGMSRWEETSGQTQNSLQEIYLLTGLGTPWGPPGGAGEGSYTG